MEFINLAFEIISIFILYFYANFFMTIKKNTIAIAQILNIKHVIVLMAILYLLFPTNNSSLDAYAYAAQIKFGQHLFSSHHLLYNAFIYIIIYPIKQLFENVDILLLSKYINSIFVLINLIIFYQILSKLNLVKKEKLLYVLIIGFSFSLWRYGTENETYIIPIAFSLLGSLYCLKYIKDNHVKYIFYSGLFATIACLFHQVHFFWWLGLFVGTIICIKKSTPIFIYSLTALIVPIVYLLVLIFYQNHTFSFENLFYFVFHDFYTGSANTEFGWKNFFFVILNSFRTFFQIHPNIDILIKRNLLFIVPILWMIYFIYVLIRSFLKKGLFTSGQKGNTIFINIHFLILILHFLFAFYSVGNVEFMVMVPFLLLLTLFVRYKINFRVLSLFAITLFIWNISYGIYPNNHFKYYNDEVFLDFIIKHPDDLFIVENADLINKFYYKTGIDNYENIILADKVKSKSEFEFIFTESSYLFTDIINKPQLFNRAKIISINAYELPFNEYRKEKILIYEGLYGISTVFKIQPKP